MAELSDIVKDAKSPEDIFGPLDTPVSRAKRTWRKIAAVLHPDRGGDEDLYKKAATHWQLWQEAVSSGAAKAKTTTSNGPELIARGSVANLFMFHGDVLKVSRTPAGDKKVKDEFRTVKEIFAFLDGSKNEKLKVYFPQTKDQLVVNGRAAFTMEHNDGFIDLDELHKYFPNGVPGRQLAWIFRRLVVALRVMEDAGVHHGNIHGHNIMIHPEQHGVRLVGLTESGGSGKVADDVKDAGSTFLRLAETGSREEKYFKGLSSYPLPPSRLAPEYDRFIEKLYGPRRFVPMELGKV